MTWNGIDILVGAANYWRFSTSNKDTGKCPESRGDRI